jgi:hypothetical protein
VAHQPVVGAVIGERNGTVRAAYHLAALGAFDDGVVPSAVEQQNRLLALLQIEVEFIHQHTAQPLV